METASLPPRKTFSAPPSSGQPGLRELDLVAVTRLVLGVALMSFVLSYEPIGEATRPEYVVPIGLMLVAIPVSLSLAQLAGRGVVFEREVIVWLDVAVVIAFNWLYSFDPGNFIFASSYLVLMEAGLVFGMRRTLLAWGAIAAAYILEEWYSAQILEVGSAQAFVVILRLAAAGAVAAVVASLSSARAAALIAREHRLKAEELQAADEMKTAFLRAVSHELRTPLAAISGFAHLLAAKGPDMDREQLTGIFEAMESSARKLEQLFGELLDLDRLSRGVIEPHLAPENLRGLAEKVVGEIDAGRHDVSVTGDPIVIPVDGPKVERIVNNLVSNAIKHTAPATRIEVRIESVADGALIVVEDDGDGIPDPIKADIFEPFRQGSPSAPGTGIGLSLVAKFAELHGGRAWVEDGASRGAAFKVHLPAKA